jgi:hypothetical protein
MRVKLQIGTAVALLLAFRPGRAADPWWEQFGPLVETADVAQAQACGALADQCGAADDPAWGLFCQQLRMSSAAKRVAELHARGLRAMSYMEGFGTAETYVAQLKRGPDGQWLRGADGLTRVFRQHWGWQEFDGTGEIRWIGLHDYYDDDDWARPFTRLHPRYGAPPITYPDGRPATGVVGDAADPRHRIVYDAACSKNVLGSVDWEYDYNAQVTRLMPPDGHPHGPLTGLVHVDNLPLGPPDPGFTPEEWARLKRPGWAGVVAAGKDTACPAWIDYTRASVRVMADLGIDGLWVDNWSPWDSFSARPIARGFGEWSVAGFRGWLAEHVSAARLQEMGVTDTATFDVRAYLRAQCRAWGGHDDDLNDRVWRDPRWRDDPVWRAYLIYKRQTGTAALSRMYAAIKQTAAECGRPDFLVSGNDIPCFALGWPRGDLDMVSTELTWGWHLTTGPRGLMPPPTGSYVPVYKLARPYAKSRFVNAWLYVPENELGRPNVARVLYYQGLANHAFPMLHYPGRCAGSPAVDAEVFGFVRRIGPELGSRLPLEEVGLYHSSSDQLLEMMPGGFRNHALQPHSFSFWGWGTALTERHVAWRAVPEWQIDAEHLAGLKLLIVPHAEVFETDNGPALQAWLRGGGKLLLAGACGVRQGESGLFTPDLAGVLTRLAGAVTRLPDDPGLPFYLADAQRPSLLAPVDEALAAAGFGPDQRLLTADGVPATVGLTPHARPGAMFVDVNNTDLDLAADTIRPTPPLSVTVTLPADLRGKRLTARLLTPQAPAPGVTVGAEVDGRVRVTCGRVELYGSIEISGEGAVARRR